MSHPVAAGTGRRVRVQALVWGRTEADLDRALSHAQGGSSRGAWEFVDEQRSTSPTCPLDLKDKRALAADQGYHWAYVVLHADGWQTR